MIAVQLGVSIPEALAQLRAAAFAAHRPILDIAQDVIARRLAFSHDRRCCWLDCRHGVSTRAGLLMAEC
jgi:hypothetical protein